MEPDATLLHAIANLIASELERSRNLEKVRRAEEARRSEDKSVMVDALAHDLRTPLTSIKAAITCLLSQGSEPDRELLKVIDEETDRLNQLVGEAIDVARIQAGAISLEKSAHDVGELISAALKEMDRLCRAGLFKFTPRQICRKPNSILVWSNWL